MLTRPSRNARIGVRIPRGDVEQSRARETRAIGAGVRERPGIRQQKAKSDSDSPASAPGRAMRD
jgi:hypothetical protein